MGCVSLGGQLAELCGGTAQVTVHDLCKAKPHPTLARVEPVIDRVGEVAAFLGGRAGRDRITRQDRPVCLPVEDLA